MFWIVILSTSVSLFSFQLKAYILWSGLLAMMASSVLLARLHRAPLEFAVQVPDRVRQGQPFRVDISVCNLGRRVARDQRVRFLLPRPVNEPSEPCFVSEIAPGQTQHFQQTLTAHKRGAYQLRDLLQETCFPYGLWRDVLPHKKEFNFLVYPHYHPIRELDIPVGRKYQPGGLALTSFLGDSTEFLSTRDFRLGDPLRHIHWRSWARLGKPIVKEYGEEYFCRLALVVDTVVSQGATDRCLEQAISLAAAITDYLSRQEYVIDIFAAGPKLYYLQAGRSLAYLKNILDILACLEPTPPDDVSFEEMESTLKQELEGISTTILLFTEWDPKRARLVDELRQSGTAIRGFLISDDETLAHSIPEYLQWVRPGAIEAGIDVL